MLRIKLNDREFLWDSAQPMTAGDLAAAREIGLGLDGIQALFGRLSAAIGSDPAKGRMLEFAELVVQVAFLAAARQDHQLRYRDFAYSISIADLKSIVIDGGEDAKTAPAANAEPGSALGEALAAATAPAVEPPAPAKRSRKTRATS